MWAVRSAATSPKPLCSLPPLGRADSARARPRRRGDRMKRRAFITLLGGAAAWPLAAGAQQSSMRRIGFLGPLSEQTQLQWTTAFLKGLRDHGWIEGTTISIDYRWAEGRSDRVAELAAELVRREVNIIVTAGTEPTIVVKQATA